MIAAAVSRPLRERQKNAVGGEIAGRVITGCRWQERRAVGASSGAALGTKARHRLRHLLPATAMAERTISAVAVDRSVNDTWPECREQFGSEAELADHAGTIALREDVRALYQGLQTRCVFALREIEEAAALAVIRIKHVFWDLRQALGRDHQHFRSVFSERTSSHRTGEDAGEVQ